MTGKILKYFGCAIAIFLLIVSCAPFKPQVRSTPNGLMAAGYSLYGEWEKMPDRWWESLVVPELNALIEEALSDNLELRETWARLRQARASAVQAGAGLYPDLSLGGEGTARRQKSDQGTSDTESYQLGLASSYELDLWGRVRSERQAALLAEKASREDYHTAAMTLAAEVANRYVEIISQRRQKQLLEEQLKANRIYLELVELRFFNSMVSALDVYQQKQIVEKAAAEIPLVEQQEQLLRHELAVLLGKPPQAVAAIEAENFPTVGVLPDLGLPADLLAKRPDVRAAGLRLQGADWQVAAARADRLPAIRLSGQGAFASTAVSALFDHWFLQLAGSLSGPIFDGGKKVAEVERTRAVAEERLAAYRLRVLTAIKEVEDALVSEQKQKENITLVRERIATARKALEQATDRYRKGINDYLPVLTQLISVQDLEQNLIQKEASLLKSRISLYRALGGSWMEELKPADISYNERTNQ
ncbi:MAG: efflux transporter outer membrane subunit [Deltaproteobacteria bacterium]|nr:efflux transporter outer membrane subunit [Deltaproteobacteria bacterium]